MRQSLKAKRDPVDFERGKHIQAFLRQQAARGKIHLYYFDGSGFSTLPCVPYGWRQRGETRRLPTASSKRLNVLGFMSLSNDSFFHTVEGHVDSLAAMTAFDAFDAFAARYAPTFAQTKRPCFVILDNTPPYTPVKGFLLNGMSGGWREFSYIFCQPTALSSTLSKYFGEKSNMNGCRWRPTTATKL